MRIHKVNKQPVTFDGEEYNVFRGRYPNNHASLILSKQTIYENIHEDDIIVSLNLIEENQALDEVAIKNYSEMEGALGKLIREEIISEPLRHSPSGHVTVPICKLLM